MGETQLCKEGLGLVSLARLGFLGLLAVKVRSYFSQKPFNFGEGLRQPDR